MPNNKFPFIPIPDRINATSTVIGPPITARKCRYARASSANPCASLTPVRVEILRFLAEMRFLSLPQIAKVCCLSARQDLSEKSARRQMRTLFDAGLVDVLPISRAALAPPDTPNDAFLLHGSAPNIYTPTVQGLETLYRAGLLDKPTAVRKKPAYGPKNSLFLAHELAVRDVRVWLETIARKEGHELERWQDGEAAAMYLNQKRPPFSVRPDAWFVLRLQKVVLVGLVEVDRGTERGDRRWQEKLTAYEALFENGNLTAVTGYVNARVLVITPNAGRRDWLSGFIADQDGPATSKFWIAASEVMTVPSLGTECWRQPRELALKPLVLCDWSS